MPLPSSDSRTLKSLFNTYECNKDDYINVKCYVLVEKRWRMYVPGQMEGRGRDVGVATILSLSALGGDKMARTASHPSSRSLHRSMCLPTSPSPTPTKPGCCTPGVDHSMIQTSVWLVAVVMCCSYDLLSASDRIRWARHVARRNTIYTKIIGVQTFCV